MKIPLSQGKFAVIDDEDYTKELTTTVCGEEVTVRICDRKWCVHFGHSNFYAVTKVRLKNGKRTNLPLHRLILGIPSDSKLQCDHINRDGLDNRRGNLRWVTNSQNHANGNKHRNVMSSEYMGVCWDRSRKKWFVRIRFRGKMINIGRFNEEIDAAKAYDRKKKELYGDFLCSLNFGDV